MLEPFERSGGPDRSRTDDAAEEANTPGATGGSGILAYPRRSVFGRSAAYTWRWLGPVRKRLLLSPLLATLLTGAETLVLLLAARLLLTFVEGEETVAIGYLGVTSISFYEACAMGAGLLVLAAVLRYLYARYTAGLVEVAVRRARESLLEGSLYGSWQQQRSHRLGELQRLLATNGTMAGVPVLLMATLLNAGSAIVLYFAIVALSSPELLVIAAGIIVGLLVVFAPLRRMLKARAREYAQAIAELQLDATSFSSLKREIELYAVQEPSLDRLRASNRSLAAVFREQMILQRLIPPLYQLALIGGIVAAVAFARGAGLTGAGVGTAAILLLRSLSYVQQLNTNLQNAVVALPLLADIDGYVTTSAASRSSYGASSLTKVESIELQGVGFAYGGDRVLEGVDVSLRAGDRIGIVGPSGSGKSTLAHLLVRLTEATEGSVIVNGQPINAYDQRSWASEVGFVGQDPLLLRGSVEENVRLFRDASREAVESALTKAHLLDEVRRLPNGLETQVGEGSNSLSGGQRQRLGIARALLTGPSVLVLDEPSSALDAESEQEILASLANVDPTSILVIISHRPKLLETCNRTIRIEAGRVVHDQASATARVP